MPYNFSSKKTKKISTPIAILPPLMAVTDSQLRNRSADTKKRNSAAGINPTGRVPGGNQLPNQRVDRTQRNPCRSDDRRSWQRQRMAFRSCRGGYRVTDYQ